MISDKGALSIICSAAEKDGAKTAVNISMANVLAACFKQITRRYRNKKMQSVCGIFTVDLFLCMLEC
jgi:hypothetical protein